MTGVKDFFLIKLCPVGKLSNSLYR